MARMFLPLIIITSVISLLHWFIYTMVAHSFLQTPYWLMVTLVIGVLLMPGSLIMGMSKFAKQLTPLILLGHTWMGVFMIAFFFSVVQVIIMLFPIPIHSSWILFATLLITLWSLRINFSGPKLITHKLNGPEFLRGLRLLQISDLHVGMPTLKKEWLQRVVDRIQKAAPDIVVVTGDLVDGPFAETAPLLLPLAEIKSPKFYVTGNHEYIREGDWEAKLQELGFRVLHNSNEVIARNQGHLLIGGVPDRMVKRFQRNRESNPDNALMTKAQVGYKILLAHEPSSVFDLKNETCDLILSGHTHGGQIFPFGVFVRMVQPVVAGFKTINDIRVFAHQGTGFWGPPMRWFTRSEIVIFEWL